MTTVAQIERFHPRPYCVQLFLELMDWMHERHLEDAFFEGVRQRWQKKEPQRAGPVTSPVLTAVVGADATLDIDPEYEWYVEQAGGEVADRYLVSLQETRDVLCRQPDIGIVRRFSNPASLKASFVLCQKAL